MNLYRVPVKPPFEGADGIQFPSIRDRYDAFRGRGYTFHFRKIIALIGRDPNCAARSERSFQGSKKSFREEPASGMAALRPGIGKHQVKRGDRSRGEKMTNRVGNLATQDAGVREAVRSDFVARGPHPPDETLHSKKIPLPVRRR